MNTSYIAELELSVSSKTVQVYILGMSHVSRQSCNHIAQLIAAVTPRVVLLELCKDRVDLLVDSSSPPPQHWHSRVIELQPATAQQSSSAAKARSNILSKLHCQPGRAFTASEIEQDCIQLLSSGMFAFVLPVTQPASTMEAPMFVQSTDQVHTIAPLGSLRFQVAPRKLPPIQTLALSNSSHHSSDSLHHILQTAQSQLQQGTSSVAALVEVHDQLQSHLKEQGHQHVNISFDGVDTGQVQVAVSGAATDDEASITGLEGSAKAGKGWGIQPFQPRSQPLPSVYESRPDASSSTADKAASPSESTQWRSWSQKEMNAAQPSTSGRSDETLSGSANAFTNFVTQTYARYQREAGEAAGVGSGEAWRVAFQAAAQHGASQVHLGDKPAIAMSQRMSQGIWNGTVPYLGAALLLTLTTLTSSATHVLPSDLLPVSAIATLGVLGKGLYSVIAPLLEIQQLSRLSAKEIEGAVDLREPLQNGSKDLVKLWGEDALLSWPGALEPVIHERDAHMAKSIWAAATGTAGSPAYVVIGQGKEQTWQYMMPAHAVDSEACPTGHGSGVYKAADGVQSVVAVVGSAHVRGITAELQQMQRQQQI